MSSSSSVALFVVGYTEGWKWMLTSASSTIINKLDSFNRTGLPSFHNLFNYLFLDHLFFWSSLSALTYNSEAYIYTHTYIFRSFISFAYQVDQIILWFRGWWSYLCWVVRELWCSFMEPIFSSMFSPSISPSVLSGNWIS